MLSVSLHVITAIALDYSQWSDCASLFAAVDCFVKKLKDACAFDPLADANLYVASPTYALNG